MSIFLFIILIIVCVILILVGLLGIVLPMLPGLPIVWLGIFIYAVFTGFEKVSVTLILIFLGMTVFGLVIDYISQVIGVKKFGASRWGVLGAVIGLIAGLFSFNLIGVIIGPALGAFVFELLLAKKKPDKALRASLGSFWGYLAGSLIKLIIALIMVGLFISRLF